MPVSNQSRYNHSTIVQVVNSSGQRVERDHFDILQRLVQTVSSNNHELFPTRQDNWSRIAWRSLGNGRFWWIIADYSSVVDPFTDLLPQQRIQYIAQLTAPLSTGQQQQITLDRPKRVKRGTVYRVQNLDPAALTSYDVAVLGVDDDTGVVEISPITISVAIPAALSRVSLVRSVGVKLIVPDIHRALFEALNFANPLATLVE